MKIGEIGMNIKKVVVAVLILSSMTAVSASAAEFNDIKGHWAEDVKIGRASCRERVSSPV